MTRERPTIFSGESVRAILAGRKTQTRRVVRPFPLGGHVQPLRDGTWEHSPDGGFDWNVVSAACPFGRPGDRLWVREAFHWAGFTEDGEVAVRYVADAATRGGIMPPEDWSDRSFENAWIRWSEDMEAAGYEGDPDDPDAGFEWLHVDRPGPTFVGRRVAPLFLPRWASRITLEVVSVRVERLQAMDGRDAQAEGYQMTPVPGCGENDWWCHGTCRRHGKCQYRSPPLVSFGEAWDRLNAKRGHGWDANPWVWVVKFKKVEASHDRS